MIGKQSRARVALSVAAIAAAATSALSFTAVASATTFPVTGSTNAALTASLNTEITAANADTSGSAIITLPSGNYSPTATLAITNTHEAVTFQGPAPTPNVVGSAANIQGGSIVPTFNPAISIASGVTVNLDNVEVSGSGGSGNGAIADSGTLNGSGLTLQGNNGPLAILSGATASLTNSTIADAINTGVTDTGTLTLTNSDVINSGAGGIANSGHTLNLVNSIVADNNQSVTTAKDCFAAATTVTTSIDGDGTCGVGTTLGGLDATQTFTSLTATITNGGTTPTYAPSKATAAIGAATAASCPLTDQRGFSRPVTGCDIGAVQTSTTGPSLTSPSGTVTVSGSAPTVYNYTQVWAGAGFPVQPSTESCTPASGSTFSNTATTPVNCTAKDYYGNSGTGTFSVKVAAATAPTVTITPTGGTANSNVTVTGTSAAGASVGYTATATDAIDGSITPTCKVGSTTVTSPYTFPFGTSTLTCTATDSNSLTGTQSITVTVNDTAPTLSLPASFSVFGAAGSSVTVNYPSAATATDLKDGTETVTCTPIANGSSIASFPAATTPVTVTCTATNTSAQTSTGTFVITEVPGLPTQVTGNVQGHVKCTEGLTQPPFITTYGTANDIADFGYFQVGVDNQYTTQATTSVTDTCSKATLNIQDTNTSTTFAGHLLSDNPAVAPTSGNPNPDGYELTSALQAAATSTNSNATGGGTSINLTSAPQGLLSYTGPVNADPVTVYFAQHIAATQPLVDGDYSATVLLTISTTP